MVMKWNSHTTLSSTMTGGKAIPSIEESEKTNAQLINRIFETLPQPRSIVNRPFHTGFIYAENDSIDNIITGMDTFTFLKNLPEDVWQNFKDAVK